MNPEENNTATPEIKTEDPQAQAIIDKMNGVVPDDINPDDKLPSDEPKEGKDKVFAGKYDSVDKLKDGIKNIGSELPQYVIDGMSDEALEQHYLELQKDFSSKGKDDKKGRKNVKQEEKKDDSKDGTGDSNDNPSTAITPELWNEVSTEFNSNGALTNELYDKFNKVGIPDEVIDQYIDGLQAKTQAFTNKVYDLAGGQEEYNSIKEWAENGGIPPEQLDAISNLTDQNAILISLEGIKAKYNAANSDRNTATRLTGNTGTQSQSGYKTQDDYLTDVRDKRYGINRAYTESVDKKLRASKF